MSAGLYAIDLVHLASLWPATRAFARALADPARAQAARLRAILRVTEGSALGKAYGLERIGSVADFQARVPRATYDDLAPYLERAAAGSAGELSREPLLAFERTSGSSGRDKLVPITRSSLGELSAATSPWLYDLHRLHPALLGTQSYWSLSPVTRQSERTAGGVRVGLADDSEYFGPLGRYALSQKLAVGPEVARQTDVDAWRRETCRRLLAARELGLISVWSPSFLTLLMRELERDLAALASELSPQRRHQVERALAAAPGFCGEALWPRLRVISAWADAAAAQQLPGLAAYFPRTLVQAKGLLATEGVVSIPYGACDAAQGAVLAVRSHFLELVDLDDEAARPRLAHELRVGGRYSLLLTTGAGLCRYRLDDIVECTGHELATPRLRFVGRLDKTSDVCGEKLSAPAVERAVAAALSLCGLTAEFTLLAPESADPPRYVLYLDTAASPAALAELAVRLEQALAEGFHYAHARRLGQLGAVEVVRASGAWQRYTAALVARGMRLGDIKPVSIDAGRGWRAVLAPERSA